MSTLGAIASLPAMTLLWREGVQQLLEGVADELQDDDPYKAKSSRVGVPTLELLNDIAQYSPDTLGTCGPALNAAMMACTGGKGADGKGSPDAGGKGGAGSVEACRRPQLLLLLRLAHAASSQLALAGASKPSRWISGCQCSSGRPPSKYSRWISACQ